MKVRYDPQIDSLTITLHNIPIKKSDEIRDGLIANYGGDDRIVAIEMLDASENATEQSRTTVGG